MAQYLQAADNLVSWLWWPDVSPSLRTSSHHPSPILPLSSTIHWGRATRVIMVCHKGHTIITLVVWLQAGCCNYLLQGLQDINENPESSSRELYLQQTRPHVVLCSKDWACWTHNQAKTSKSPVVQSATHSSGNGTSKWMKSTLSPQQHVHLEIFISAE